MKDKIKEVQEYLKSKLFAGEFKVISVEEIQVHVQIDDEFDFNLWVHKDISFEQWSNKNCMYLGKFTEEEVQKGFAVFNPIKKEWNDKLLKSEKLRKYNELKKELEDVGLV